MDASGIFARFIDRVEQRVEAAGATVRGCGDPQRAVLDAAAGHDRVARTFDHGVGLAGQRGFIDQRDAFGNFAVDRHTFARADEHFIARNNAVHRDPFAMAGGIDALAGVEGSADFLDGAAQGVAALTREDGAEGVDGHKNGNDFVVNAACSGQRALHRGEKGTDDANEEKLFEDDLAALQRVPRFAQDGQTGKQEYADRGERQRAVENPACIALHRRHVDREAEDHGLRGEEAGHADAQPRFGLAIQDQLLGFLLARRAVAAGGHSANLSGQVWRGNGGMTAGWGRRRH